MVPIINRKGFSLIELVTTMTVVAIIGAVTAGIIIYLVQLVVYAPREMKAKTIAHEAIETMIEGDTLHRGMRYAAEVVDASADQFSYKFGYPLTVNIGPTPADRRGMSFAWDVTMMKLRRLSTAFGGDTYIIDEIIPYYATSEIAMTCHFKYFDGTGLEWDATTPLYNIRRVEIDIQVRTGTGLFQNWEGSFHTVSSVDIKEYI